jgi:Peptidase inhibitor family I36
MRIKSLLVSASIGAVLAAAAASPASAATGYARCPDLRMCVFTGPDGTGAIAYFATGDGNLGDSSGPVGMNNNIESIWNRSGHTWELYDGVGFSGTRWVSNPFVGHNNVIPSAANKVSSLRDT